MLYQRSTINRRVGSNPPILGSSTCCHNNWVMATPHMLDPLWKLTICPWDDWMHVCQIFSLCHPPWHHLFLGDQNFEATIIHICHMFFSMWKKARSSCCLSSLIFYKAKFVTFYYREWRKKLNFLDTKKYWFLLNSHCSLTFQGIEVQIFIKLFKSNSFHSVK